MKKYSYIVAVVVTILFMFNGASASAYEWNFDTAHSGFYFSIDHIYSKVKGHFDDYSGKFRFDPDNLKESSIEIRIKTKSLNTNVRKRDNHLRSDDFFDASKYPLITFTSTAITQKSGNIYNVEGRLTIKDVTKKITVPLAYLGTKDHPLEKGLVVAGFETALSINRLDYHVGDGKFHRVGVAGKNVGITVSIEMLRNK